MPNDSFVNKPVLLIAPRKITDTSRSNFNDIFSAFIHDYELLSSNLDVKVLTPSVKNAWSLPFFKTSQSLIKKYPNANLPFNISCENEHFFTLWPRDLFQVYDNLIFSSKNSTSLVTSILNNLNISSNNLSENNFGIGGFVVRDRDLIVTSDYISDNLTFKELSLLGYEVHNVPVLKFDNGSTLAKRMSHNHHLDTEFNLVHNKSGDVFTLVNESYYSFYKKQVDSINRKINANMCVVKENTSDYKMKSLNFISLPNWKVMIPGNSPKTKSFLEAALGKENVLVSKITDPCMYSGKYGGLRCMSNLIQYIS